MTNTKTEGAPVHELQLDIAHDCTVGELFSFMESYSATIVAYQAIGPAGGNPLVTFGFSDAPTLHLFRATYQTGFCNPVSIVHADMPHEQMPDVNEEDLPERGEGRGMEPTK